MNTAQRHALNDAVRKAAWAACEVNDCGGTRKKPCFDHIQAAEKFVRESLARFERADTEGN